MGLPSACPGIDSPAPFGYSVMMKRDMKMTVRKFASFEEAERADLEEYAAMTPDERVALVQVCRELGRGLGNGHSAHYPRRAKFRRVHRVA